MYGGKFKQKYGWYISQQAYEWGINYAMMSYVEELVPDEILDEFDFFKSPQGTGIMEVAITDNEEAKQFQKSLRQQNRRVRNLIENSVRQQFGFKGIGENWINESVLYRMVKQLYPESEVIHHYRPDFLGRQELDIYIAKYNIGIEYQGIQHFQPVDFWGGQEAFDKTVERDRRKREACEQNSVTLIYFKYDEELTIENIKSKIDRAIADGGVAGPHPPVRE